MQYHSLTLYGSVTMVTLPNKEVTISQVNGNCQRCSSSLDHSRGAIMSNGNKEEGVRETGHVSDNDLVGVIYLLLYCYIYVHIR